MLGGSLEGITYANHGVSVPNAIASMAQVPKPKTGDTPNPYPSNPKPPMLFVGSAGCYRIISQERGAGKVGHLRVKGLKWEPQTGSPQEYDRNIMGIYFSPGPSYYSPFQIFLGFTVWGSHFIGVHKPQGSE